MVLSLARNWSKFWNVTGKFHVVGVDWKEENEKRLISSRLFYVFDTFSFSNYDLIVVCT